MIYSFDLGTLGFEAMVTMLDAFAEYVTRRAVRFSDEAARDRFVADQRRFILNFIEDYTKRAVPLRDYETILSERPQPELFNAVDQAIEKAETNKKKLERVYDSKIDTEFERMLTERLNAETGPSER